MHLPHLSPTGLAGRTTAGDSMDDDSSSSVMGYGNPYLASGMSRELANNLTQDPDAAYRYVGKLNAQQRDSTGWKMDKLCDGRPYDSPSLVDWLAGEEEEQGHVRVARAEKEKDVEEEEEKVNSDNKIKSDDEEKSSTEDDAKCSEGGDSSTEGTVSGDEDEDGAEGPATFPEAECIAPDSRDFKSQDQKVLRPRRKLKLDYREEESPGPEEDWQSDSSEEAQPSQTESAEECEKKPGGVAADTAGSPLSRPVLCFDEYGNLTTSYQDPEEAELPAPFASVSPPPAISKEEWDSPADASVAQEPRKALRSKARSSLESSESAAAAALVSEQELQLAFKEEINTAATSRYGRTRKRKTADGFFFGTINFNELRKITSGGSPKKGSKATTPKTTSPEVKAKAREEPQPSVPVGMEAKDLTDLNENGIDTLDGHPINGEEEVVLPPQGTVQMDQTKESTLTVQNKKHKTKKKKKPASRRRRRSSSTVAATPTTPTTPTPTTTTPTPTPTPTHTPTPTTTTTPVAEGEVPNPDPGQEAAASITKSVDAVEASDATASQAPVKPKRQRYRGKSRASASLDFSEVLPQPLSRRSSRSATALAILACSFPASEETTNDQSEKEEEGIKEELVTEDLIKQEPVDASQGDESLPSHVTQGGAQEGAAADDDLGAAEVKIEEEEQVSSITKSGRVTKKPQLMDISNEAKRQKETRDQQRQNEALMNSSLDEELSMSTVSLQVLEKEHPCQFMVGDLVWVHIRGSPLWPSMISYDPVLGMYSRMTTKCSLMYRYTGIRMYHVQFFSDNSLANWISPASIIPYEGLDKLKDFLVDLKSKVKYSRRYRRGPYEGILKTLIHINKASRGRKYDKWMAAIAEANTANEMDRYERIQKHAVTALDAEANQAATHAGARLSSKGPKGSQGQASEGQVEKKKRGRPRKSSLGEAVGKASKTDGDSRECEFSGFEDVTTEGNKQRRASLASRMHRQKAESYARENLEALVQENPGMSEEAALKKLRWRWKKLNGAQGGRPKGAGGKRKHQRGGESSNELEDEEGSSSGGGSTKRQRLEEDGGRGVYKVVRNEKVCSRCEGVSVRAGSDMVRCKGLCCSVFHLGCLGLATMPRRDFKCEECLTERHPCFICKSSVSAPVQRCSVPHCGKFYHDACIQRWPQVARQRQQEKLVCPRHICHMCAANADDVGDSLARLPPFTRCLRCPTTYHTGEGCMAAGTEEVSQSSHICTKHLQLPKNISHHVNVNWCFCCSKGGSLLLCDQCPAAFHADCMKIEAPEGGYVCEDCEGGKFPVYGDVVWVKLGLYRWWPGQVLHPRFIPDNIENLPHQQGMFCVHFFGSNDYYWVTRGRAFLYQEGDKGSRAQSSRTLEMQFRRAVGEALEAYREQKTKRNLQELRWSEKGNLKPPPYVRIDYNRPVGNVRLSKVDLAAINRCDCEPNADNPCGSDEKCLNRMLMFECLREVCGAGDRCGNQRFQKKKYPSVCCFKTDDRGWGLKTLQSIDKGEFVIEYVGELIDDEEFRRRIDDMHDVKEENYYFLTIDKDIMIDAGPKGNLARFMNNSCQPNCETQKWTVGGDTRVGLFAIEDIPADSELTFNYNLQCVGTEKKRCCCGAPNCSGFIGGKVQKTELAAQQKKREKNGKKRPKKRRREVKLSEDECFRCGGSGNLILCDGVDCPKGYHLECLGLKKLPRGKWICPWHHCDECGQWSTRLNRCDYCPNSYCRQHLMENLHHIPGLGCVCSDHNTDELEALRGQMDAASVIENTEAQDQHKSDADSDCGHDGTLPPPASPSVEPGDPSTADAAAEGQQKTVEQPGRSKVEGKSTAPRKPRRRSSQLDYRKRRRNRYRKRKVAPSLPQADRVEEATGQSKGGEVKPTEEKAKHVNEA